MFNFHCSWREQLLSFYRCLLIARLAKQCACMYNIIGTYVQCTTRLIYWHHMHVYIYIHAIVCTHIRSCACYNNYIKYAFAKSFVGYIIANYLIYEIYQIKRHCIHSLCAYSFWTTQKSQSPTLSNHISALIMRESHKMQCRTVSHHHLDKCCDWHNRILYSWSSLTVHTYLVIYIAQLYPSDAHARWWFHYYFFSVHAYPQKDTVKIASYSNGGIDCLVKEISVCLYIKM